jgi:hypothetical protein
MGLPLQTVEYNDLGGGLDLISSAVKTAEDDSTDNLNIDYTSDGAFFTRYGSSIFNVGHQTDELNALASFDYRTSSGKTVNVVQFGAKIYHGLTNPTAAVTGLDDTAIPDMEMMTTINDELLFWGNGVDDNLVFDGTNWRNWSLPRPVAPSLADAGVGTLDEGDYTYYYAFAVTIGGVIVKEGQLSPAASINIAASHNIAVTIGVSTDPQVNARVIYRVSPTSIGVPYRATTILNNVDVLWTDNVPDDGTIEANFENMTAPKTAIFECFNNKMYMRDENYKTDYLVSAAYKPWSVSETTRARLDGEIRCIKKTYDTIIIGTDRSIWLEDAAGNLRRISSKIGILNNRCADGERSLFIFTTSRKLYAVNPTDYTQDEMRLSDPISMRVEPLIKQLGGASDAKVCLKYFTKPNCAKLVMSLPLHNPNNDTVLVFNEHQSIQKGKPCWQVWDNINAAFLQTFQINGKTELVSGDFNGFVWKQHDESKHGDGAEVNGTSSGGGAADELVDTTQIDHTGNVTAAAAFSLTDGNITYDTGTASAGGVNTVTDATKAWGVNAWAGERIFITAGTGNGQERLVGSNTATEITTTVNWTIQPDATSHYRVGGWRTNEWSTKHVFINAGTGSGQDRVVASNTADTLAINVAFGVVPDATSTYQLGGWGIDDYKGISVRLTGGKGAGQHRTILSNNTDTLTLTAPWTEAPDDTTEYSIGGYVSHNYTNWKAVVSSYEDLKQLWYLWINANASGDYQTKLILQFDFDTSILNQEEILVDLQSENTIWGAFIWGAALWGSRSVFLDRFRKYAKFRAIRVGFYHDKAGQPFQINNFAMSVQDKGKFFRTR